MKSISAIAVILFCLYTLCLLPIFYAKWTIEKEYCYVDNEWICE